MASSSFELSWVLLMSPNMMAVAPSDGLMLLDLLTAGGPGLQGRLIAVVGLLAFGLFLFVPVELVLTEQAC